MSQQDTEVLDPATNVATETTENNSSDKSRDNVRVKGSKKSLTITEKTKIEGLIQTRTKELESHLQEIVCTSDEVIRTEDDGKSLEIQKIESEKLNLDIKLRSLTTAKSAEWSELETGFNIVKREYDDKQKRASEKWNADHSAKVSLAKFDLDQKYEEEISKLERAKKELNDNIEEARRVIERNRILQGIVVRGRVESLRDAISDRRQEALETLWTRGDEVHVAEEVLDMLPNARSFRDGISATRFLLGTEEIQEIVKGQQVMCKNCPTRPMKYELYGSSGRLRCQNCGHSVQMSPLTIQKACKKAVDEILPQLTAPVNAVKQLT